MYSLVLYHALADGLYVYCIMYYMYGNAVWHAAWCAVQISVQIEFRATTTAMHAVASLVARSDHDETCHCTVDLDLPVAICACGLLLSYLLFNAGAWMTLSLLSC